MTARMAQMAGIGIDFIAYRGGAPALLDLQAGRIQAMFAATQEAGPSTEAGKTRALAVTSAGRVASLAQIPPIADALPGFEVLFWQGVFGPAGMPLPVVARIEAAARAATMDETVKARLASQGIAAWTATAEGLRTALVRDLEIWSRVIREGNIRAE
jgi:tripartite-type tricarboxylate transporter receptor subunit TctC